MSTNRQWPDYITAGTSQSHRLAWLGYSPAAWQATIYMRGLSSISLAATADVDRFVFSADADTTSTWAAGEYVYTIRMVELAGTRRLEAETGRVTILADVAAIVPGKSITTHAERMVAILEAVLEKRATTGELRYKINDREIQKTPIEELKRLLDKYRSEVVRARRAAAGRLFAGKVVFR